MNPESDAHIAPCPFCGGKCGVYHPWGHYENIVCPRCGYESADTSEIEDPLAAHNALTENAATLETIAQYVANVLNDPDSLPEWYTAHTVATTINRIITAAPVPAELHTRLAGAMDEAGKEVQP